MNKKIQTIAALALVVAPILIVFVIHMLGSRTITVTLCWNASLFHPSRLLKNSEKI